MTRYSLVAFAVVIASAFAVARALLSAVLERLGTRFAEWLLPSGQPITYRVAQCVALTSLHVANKGSAARAAADSLLGEIEMLQRANKRRRGPLVMALSLVVPSWAARMSWLGRGFIRCWTLFIPEYRDEAAGIFRAALIGAYLGVANLGSVVLMAYSAGWHPLVIVVATVPWWFMPWLVLNLLVAGVAGLFRPRFDLDQWRKERNQGDAESVQTLESAASWRFVYVGGVEVVVRSDPRRVSVPRVLQ